MTESRSTLRRNAAANTGGSAVRGAARVCRGLNRAIGKGLGYWLAVSGLAGVILLAGCAKSPDSAGENVSPSAGQGAGTAVDQSIKAASPAGSGLGSQSNAAPPGIDAAAQLAAITNQMAAAQQA
jgi:hypothetical protein